MKITNKVCNGCHACYSICPKHAIEMKKDKEGFLYPIINDGKCIECGLCSKACPLNKNDCKTKFCKDTYVAINKNNLERESSSSGGIFIVLANYVLKNGGVVYGAAFDKAFDVIHDRVEDDATMFQGSKYVQSTIGNNFIKVKEDLIDNKLVLFSGTPCQVEGLIKYLDILNINREKLIAIDIICHGVPSPLVWNKYLKEMSQNKRIDGISFRDKSVSWNEFSMKIKFDDNSEYKEIFNEDLYMKGFLSNTFLRPSCYQCGMKSENRYSDITLGDYWGVKDIHPDMYDNRGTSAVIIHSQKGKEIFEQIQDELLIKTTCMSDIIKKNSAMIKSVDKNVNRDNFFKDFSRHKSVIKVLKKLFKVSLLTRIKIKARYLLKTIFKHL